MNWVGIVLTSTVCVHGVSAGGRRFGRDGSQGGCHLSFTVCSWCLGGCHLTCTVCIHDVRAGWVGVI